MERFVYPPKEMWASLCRRPLQDDPQVRARVESILSRVRSEGDAALRALSIEIDRRDVTLEVTEQDFRDAAQKVSGAVKEAIRQAAANIRAAVKSLFGPGGSFRRPSPGKI